MIDYHKAVVPPEQWERLRDHALLDFVRPVNEETGEVAHHRGRVADFGPHVRSSPHPASVHARGSLRFRRFPSEFILLDGSWHKYAQQGANHGDFTLRQFRDSVEQVGRTFGLDPYELTLQNLEAGVNVRPSLPTAEVLRRMVCHREGVPFTPMRSRGGRSLGLELYRSDYALKLYDKGAQFGLAHEEWRFEVKFMKARTFNRLGIHALGDLLDPAKWFALEAEIMRLFNLIVIDEPNLDPKALNAATAAFLSDVRQPRYWKDLSPKERNRSRDRYARLVEVQGLPSLKDQLRELIRSKCEALRSVGRAALKGDVLTEKQERGSGGGITGTLYTSESRQRGCSHPSVIGDFILGREEGRRLCKTCGRDITDQDPRSRVCSERLYGKGAKRCRNKLSNHSLTLRRMAVRSILLFDEQPFVIPPHFSNNLQRLN